MNIYSKLIIPFVLLFIMFSCANEPEVEPMVDEAGLTRDIRDLVPQNVLDEIEGLGMPINGGANPPNIEGSYYVSPFLLLKSNIPEDIVGYQFVDYTITFSSQNQNDLTIDVNYEGINTSGTGTGSFIVGEGDKFSIFVKINDEINGYPALSVNVISGSITPDGIKDLHYALFMVNDFDDPANVIIEIGQGRLVYDSDGFSERI